MIVLGIFPGVRDEGGGATTLIRSVAVGLPRSDVSAAMPTLARSDDPSTKLSPQANPASVPDSDVSEGVVQPVD